MDSTTATTTPRDDLERTGFVVIPTELTCPARRARICADIDAEIKHEWTAREFEPGAFDDTDRPFTDTSTKLVGGGFGALGNPSAFHGTVVRKLRIIAHKAMVDANPFDPAANVSQVSPPPQTQRLGGGPPTRHPQVIDRLMKRCVGDAPSSESWHRDVATNTRRGDTVYGGWINLGDTYQTFSCIPATHTGIVPDDKGGFVASLTDHDKHTIQAHLATKRAGGIVPIPPGTMLIFNERLIHEASPAPSIPEAPGALILFGFPQVAPNKAKSAPVLRLFTGWYVSYSDEPHDSRPADIVDGETGRPGRAEHRLRARLADQVAMPLKSGQASAILPKLHWGNNPGTLTRVAIHP